MEEKRYINIMDVFNGRDLLIFEKLNIKIESKLYTEKEENELLCKLFKYYTDEEDITKYEIEYYQLSHIPENVTTDEYNYLVEKFLELESKYNID